MKKTLLSIFLMIGSIAIAETPWGKDCEMADRPSKTPGAMCNHKSPSACIGAGLIRFYQEVISPIDGPRTSPRLNRSHYKPSSSQYTLEAMHEYGFIHGVVMGCDRLMRENDEEWVYPTIEIEGKNVKWDPVKGD